MGRGCLGLAADRLTQNPSFNDFEVGRRQAIKVCSSNADESASLVHDLGQALAVGKDDALYRAV
jgi:hypothetical protein